jgi:hypothetical protein
MENQCLKDKIYTKGEEKLREGKYWHIAGENLIFGGGRGMWFRPIQTYTGLHVCCSGTRIGK